jgi:tRNA modification GTPase
MQTIFALATAKGRAGVAIIRISGAEAVNCAAELMDSVPDNRGVRNIRDTDGAVLDEALVLQFPAGHSFTGEPVIELHLHGSPAIVAAVTRRLGVDDRMRPAEAGEFTRRALDNGRLDLAQVEGLADLIDAETEYQRKQAMRVFSGALGALVDVWRADLIRAVALLEATIDFVDEEVPVDVTPEVAELLSRVMSQMRNELTGVQAAERVREGFEVAIIGKPNVGKSTLLNRLARRDVAITSEIAGTTRDVIEVRMDVEGIPVTLLDTAGLRETDDLVENLGVIRARERAEQADVCVYMLDIDDNIPQNIDARTILVRAKADLAAHDDVAVSGLTGLGVDRLITIIGEKLSDQVGSVGVAIRDRHRIALERGKAELEEALLKLQNDDGLAEITAEHIWRAIRSVDSLVGRVDVEDILDEIFSSFCIGK